MPLQSLLNSFAIPSNGDSNFERSNIPFFISFRLQYIPLINLTNSHPSKYSVSPRNASIHSFIAHSLDLGTMAVPYRSSQFFSLERKWPNTSSSHLYQSQLITKLHSIAFKRNMCKRFQESFRKAVKMEKKECALSSQNCEYKEFRKNWFDLSESV
jgi:hypothetical protein